MPFNTWWMSDPAQRYWMEITNREDLGGPLLSPKLPALTWGYDLVSQVQPGDRVLHWSTAGAESAIVGWSDVIEHAKVIPEYTWAPRHGAARTTLGWSAALAGFHPLPTPVTASQLLPLLDDIVAVDDELTRAHRGTTYFPLTRYGRNRPREEQELRAAEAYLVKFPLELFAVIPNIGNAHIEQDAGRATDPIPEDYQKPGLRAPSGRTTRAQDPALRSAIERHSLDVARDYYENDLGGTGYTEVGAPYDIDVTVNGVHRRAEVKGSSLRIDTVELTINEVHHASEHTPVDLIVVDAIEPIRDPKSGEVVGARGGRRRVWTDWTPEDNALIATKFAYSLPSGD